MEKDIQKAIIDYLQYLGAVVVKVNNVGIYKKDTNSYIPTRQLGVSDLLVCYKGKFIAIEVKRKGGKLTLHQEGFLEDVKGGGGIAFVAYSLDDAISTMGQLFEG